MADFKIVVIGAGPGGYVAAIKAAQLGASVAVVEKDFVGGTCLNRGCIPTKIFLEATGLYSRVVNEGEKFGIIAPEVSFDFTKLRTRKDEIIGKLRKGIQGLLKKNKIELIEGEASFVDGGTIQVGDRKVTAENFIIATGSVPAKPGFFPFDDKNVVSSDELLQMEKTPKSAIIVGGGYIGCEFAIVLQELGCKVTIVEMMKQILPISDEMIAKQITRAMKKKKIKIMTGRKIEKMEVVNGVVNATLDGDDKLEAEIALVSVGRVANTRGLNIEAAGVKMGERGEIPAGELGETNVPGIYAIGDVNCQLQLAHYASRQGIDAVEHIMGLRTKRGFKVCAAGIFTHPEAAGVGMTEAEAKEGGREIHVGTFPFQALGKAMAMEETAGEVKLIGDAETGELLGAHIVGPHATDLIAEAALAIEHEATLESLAAVIHSHPTLAEALMEAAEAAEGKAIHS